MAKNKKRKQRTIQMPQSEETKIRRRARNISLGKCYINSNWDEYRRANIIITRVHTNKNLTLSIFYVDLALLGVVDAFYRFNAPAYDLEFILSEMNYDDEDEFFVEVDYVLVHNIIYGSIEFAEEYGFFPDKSFQTAKYILEEDDENIPRIYVEFGIDGKPTVFPDAENSYSKEIAQLEETAGIGNFNVHYYNEIHDDEFDGDIDDNSLMKGWDDDIDKMGVPEWDEEWIDFFKQDNEQISFRVLQYFADMTFLTKHEDLSEYDAFEHVLGKANYDRFSEIDKKEVDMEEITEIIQPYLQQLVDGEDPFSLLEEINEEYKNSYDVLISAHFIILEMVEESEHLKNLKYLLSLFPEKIELYLNYSAILFDEERNEEIKELMKNRISLDMMSDKEMFSKQELSDFCKIWLMYHMGNNDLRSAEIYYQVLDTIDYNPDTQAKVLIQEIVLMKMDELAKGG